MKGGAKMKGDGLDERERDMNEEGRVRMKG